LAALRALSTSLEAEEPAQRQALCEKHDRVDDALEAAEAGAAKLRRLRDTRAAVGERIRALEGKRDG
ncbi:MAG: hypothetical protein WC718_15810, partial [Phycisphaerales bacterium]